MGYLVQYQSTSCLYLFSSDWYVRYNTIHDYFIPTLSGIQSSVLGKGYHITLCNQNLRGCLQVS